MQQKLYDVKQVAEMTGRSEIGIRKIGERTAGKSRPIGQKIGGVWVFTAADIALIKNMVNKVGRPAKAKPPVPEFAEAPSAQPA